MTGYTQIYRGPAVLRPRLAQTVPLVPPAPPAGSLPALTQGQYHAAIGLGVAETAFGIAAAWLGIRAISRERSSGFKALGWVGAIGGGLFAAINVLGTMGTISRPQA